MKYENIKLEKGKTSHKNKSTYPDECQPTVNK
jgi:hypothetical protein